ncbi:NfeD family protein [Paenibacillus beijingensis]|uniref:Membrane protease regulatory membrane protein n=1 Tax=Paenibacillus beijingensis TaxID=1126833 RepID=A0A0D5NMN9_9BACL|nr:NfeD family protein [Paenibacillus beijingensis]AJY76430.1 membrane protease regulatory membrane protein [Paenibacillus beijingensis]
METLFLSCLFVGILYALVSVVLGDWIGMAFDGAFDFLSLDGHHWFQPVTLAGAVTVFGGSGLLLERYTSLSSGSTVIISLLIAAVSALAIFFFYVKPMENSENSSGYSMKELAGKVGEVLVAIPAHGCGEVLVKVGAGNTNHIAESFDGVPIPSGAKIVVIEVKQGALFVSEFKTDLE